MARQDKKQKKEGAEEGIYMNARTGTVLPAGVSRGGWVASALAVNELELEIDAIVREAVRRVLSVKAVLDRACPASEGRCSDGAKDNAELKNRNAKAVEQRESEEEKIKRIAKQVAAEEVKGVREEVSEAKRGVEEAKRGVDEAKRGVDETKKELRRTQCGIRNGFYK